MLSCFIGADRVSKILFNAYARTQTDKHFLPILDTVRSGLIEEYTGAQELNLQAHDGDIVNGLHFPGTDDKVIIWLHGNGCFYETSLHKPLHWRNSLERDGKIPHLIVFNPRGTGRSGGRTQTSFVADDLALFFEHVQPKAVVIGGHSMGAYFTLFGAAELQQRHPEIKINFVSDRSLWDLRSRVTTSVEGAGYTGLGKTMMEVFVKSKLDSPDWCRDSLKALESLKGRVLIIFHRKDGVVPFEDSTYEGLSKAKRARDYHILELCEEDPTSEVGAHSHNRDFSEDENATIIAEMGQMLGIPGKPSTTALLSPNFKA